MDKNIKFDIAGAVAEIKEAALIILDQVQDRFPELPVLGACSLFSADFDRAKISKDVVDKKLKILAEHLAIDVPSLETEFDDLMVEVAHVKEEGCTTTASVWGRVLAHYISTGKQAKLLEVVMMWFALQAQNGSLEKNFSHKRRLQDRSQGGFQTEGVASVCFDM